MRWFFIYRIYTVGINDTIETLANQLGLTEEELRKINGFIDSYQIREGEQIILPTENTNFKTYTIQKGDNLYEIAKKYNITVKQLKLLNGLDDDYIYPGETLIVPNTKFYITEEGDSINKVYELFEIENPLENQTIYLLPNQLIVYKK